MKYISTILLLVSVIFSLSCTKDEDKVITFIIAAEKVFFNENGVEREFLQVKYESLENWTLLSEPIEGFDYSTGYEYIIEVNRRRTYNNAADAPYYSYSLIRVISKILKK